MRCFFAMLIFLAWSAGNVFAQGVFESNTTNGNWGSSGSWTLVSGSDGNGIPDSDDDVTILSGDQINVASDQASDDLTIIGTLNFSKNNTLTVNGNLVMSGSSSAITGDNQNRELLVSGNFSVSSGADADIPGITFSITGTTTIDGTLNFLDVTGDKTFGTIDINSGGVWGNGTVAEDFTINGNLINDGTFTGCSSTTGCVYSMTSSSGTISGSGTITISDLNINSPGSYTNTATLIISDELVGSGSFTNGNGASLELQGAGPFDITTFSASTNTNTVTFTGGSTATIHGGEYYNLTVNKSTGSDLNTGGAITISNILTLTSGDIGLAAHLLTISDGATISGGNADSYIQVFNKSLFRQNYSTAGTTLAFPIGDANDYSPITAFTINSGSFGIGAYLEFDVIDLNHPNRNTTNIGSGGDDTGDAVADYVSRYWEIVSNNITSPRFDATYQYVQADVTGTEANMVATIYRIHPTLAISDWLVSGTVNPTNNTVSLVNADAFGDLYVMDNSATRLPIVLLSFEAEVQGNAVRLDWYTATEINNELYAVERSANGLDFEPILFKEGAGNSAVTLHYSALDKNPIEGRSYYRLKQTDFNGASEYSEVVSVLYTSEATRFKVFPNPLVEGERLKINTPDNVYTVSIQDINGRTITRMEDIDPKVKSIELAWENHWGTGLYLIISEGSDGIDVRKLIVK